MRNSSKVCDLFIVVFKELSINKSEVFRKVRKEKAIIQTGKEKVTSFVTLSDPDSYRDFVYLCDKHRWHTFKASMNLIL